MIDYSQYKILHQHGNDWVELKPVGHPNPASGDPERTWGRGATLFRCTKCAEEVVVASSEEDHLVG